jgi:hypothetical protein
MKNLLRLIRRLAFLNLQGLGKLDDENFHGRLAFLNLQGLGKLDLEKGVIVEDKQ